MVLCALSVTAVPQQRPQHEREPVLERTQHLTERSIDALVARLALYRTTIIPLCQTDLTFIKESNGSIVEGLVS